MRVNNGDASLVRLVGIPNLVDPVLPFEISNVLKLFRLARLNKIPLLLLESMKKSGRAQVPEDQLSYYRKRHRQTLNLIALVSALLERSGIRHTIFKTLKPFPCTPVDVDVLLWSKEDYPAASRILERRGLRPVGGDLYGSTLYSSDYHLSVDLTTEVAVSGFIYLDKNSLFSQVDCVKINDLEVRTLQPQAELVTVAAHCMYKEQMFILSDYYTFALSSRYYREALEFAERANATFALEEALRLTYDITLNAFGSDEGISERLLDGLRAVGVRPTKYAGKCLRLPVKYPRRTIALGLSKKIIEDPVSRSSLPSALQSTLKPCFVAKLKDHISRTYS